MKELLIGMRKINLMITCSQPNFKLNVLTDFYMVTIENLLKYQILDPEILSKRSFWRT